MVVEEGCDGRLEKVAEEGARECVGACRIPDIVVEVPCADGWAFGVLQVK
jgi:hypothetical protein